MCVFARMGCALFCAFFACFSFWGLTKSSVSIFSSPPVVCYCCSIAVSHQLITPCLSSISAVFVVILYRYLLLLFCYLPLLFIYFVRFIYVVIFFFSRSLFKPGLFTERPRKEEFGIFLHLHSQKIMSFKVIKFANEEQEDGSFVSNRCMCDIKVLDSILFLLVSLSKLTEVQKHKKPLGRLSWDRREKQRLRGRFPNHI